jgi:hypothetical protein
MIACSRPNGKIENSGYEEKNSLKPLKLAPNKQPSVYKIVNTSKSSRDFECSKKSFIRFFWGI